MTEPMSDERLAEIREGVQKILPGAPARDVRGQMLELLDEIDQLRTHNAMHGYAAPITFTDDEHGNPAPQWPTP